MNRFLIALASVIFLVLACGAPPIPQSDGLPTTLATRPVTTMPLTARPISFKPDTNPAGAPFAPYMPNPIELSGTTTPFTLDMAALSNPEALRVLTPDQQAQLAEQGFVIVPAGFTDPLSIYAQAGADGQPVYITADLILYAAHQLTSSAIQQTERDHLSPDLQALSEALLAETNHQATNSGDENVVRAAVDNLAFFGVGLHLQNPDATFPPDVTGRIADELTLINKADGRYFSPLRRVEADYTVYAPAGAALTDEQIRGYQQSAAWYAQSSIPVDHADPALSRPAARQLLLLLHALENTQNLSRWDRVNAAQTYLDGSDFTPSVLEARSLANAVYGQIPAPAALTDLERLDRFIATWQATWGDRPFRLLPLPVRPDTPVFPALVFDRVGRFQGEDAPPPVTAQESNLGLIRSLPTGPDVAAALGSAVALDYLQASGDALYEGYAAQLAGLRASFTGRDEAAWTRTWPDGSLYTVQSLLGDETAGLPLFMTQPAWTERRVNTWFGGWAQTRHEPVWVSRPVTTSPLPAPGGFVDPVPLFYARQAALLRQFTAGLDSRELLDKGLGEKLMRLARMLDELQTIAEHELAGIPLTAEEQATIGQMGDRLARLLQVAGPPTSSGAGTLGPPLLPFVVDVFHNPQTGRTLQAAVGEAWPIYVITPGQNGQELSVGAVFSTYEFGLPAKEKWTGEEWRQAQERGEPAGWLR